MGEVLVVAVVVGHVIVAVVKMLLMLWLKQIMVTLGRRIEIIG